MIDNNPEERSESFGTIDCGDFTTIETDVESAHNSTCCTNTGSLESSAVKIVDALNEYLQCDQSPGSSSDEQECCPVVPSSSDFQVALSEEQIHSILASSKSMEELCWTSSKLVSLAVFIQT